MNEKDINTLKSNGVNWEEGVERLMGDADFYLHMLGRYAQNANFDQLKDAMEKRDLEAAYQACHALKGISGNLSLDELHQTATKACTLLREGNLDEAKAYMPRLEEFHLMARDAARLANSQ